MFTKDIVNFKVDVMYIYGELYVGKYMPDSLNHQLPTLRQAYLYPLFSRYKKLGNKLYTNFDKEVYLFVDLNYEGKKTFRRLWQQLLPYRRMLSYRVGPKWTQGKLKIILTGHAPKLLIEKMHSSYVAFQGEFNQEDLAKDNNMVPVIGMDFREVVDWNGVGNIPFDDFVKFETIASKVHDKGKKLHVYNIPENQSVWEVLNRNGVDLISTRKPEQFQSFIANAK
ncbi:hypothetical protein EMN47_11895 [Prolixibacteraceae bacterium JC049]|nr:hypothetical protein [Prolixibacteraceae bacterium JC049]